MAVAGEHRGHRLVERRSPRGHTVYHVPERYADAPISEIIRALSREGWARAEISGKTGIRYQHVRNVLEETSMGGHAAASAAEAATGDRVEIDAVGSRVAFADLVARVERGQEIRIERDGGAVARLVPATSAAAADEIAAACRRMDVLAEQATLGGLTIHELIDEGRKL